MLDVARETHLICAEHLLNKLKLKKLECFWFLSNEKIFDYDQMIN